MKTQQIKILGTDYELRFTNRREDQVLKEADGECRWYDKVIVVDEELENEESLKHVIRHEIVHAFLRESGLKSYASDELIVDWIAWHIDKIKKVINEQLQQL